MDRLPCRGICEHVCLPKVPLITHAGVSESLPWHSVQGAASQLATQFRSNFS